MTTKLIPIRDKRNGVSALLPEAYLKHPAFRDHFEAVHSTKPIVNVPPIPAEKIAEIRGEVNPGEKVTPLTINPVVPKAPETEKGSE